jgi:hypothetical protein
LYYNPSAWQWAHANAIGSRRWGDDDGLPTAASHPFYRHLNELLRDHGFDDFVESQCTGFHAETMGRPSAAGDLLFTPI